MTVSTSLQDVLNSSLHEDLPGGKRSEGQRNNPTFSPSSITHRNTPQPPVTPQRSGCECASPTSEAKLDPVSHLLQYHFCADVF